MELTRGSPANGGVTFGFQLRILAVASERPPSGGQSVFLSLLGPITDGFDDWLCASGYTAGSREFAIRMLTKTGDKSMRWERYRDAALLIPFGKTANARPVTSSAEAGPGILEMRRTIACSEWVLPAPTKSGHIEPSSIKKQSKSPCACRTEYLPIYTFRHTCLTRWADHIDETAPLARDFESSVKN